MFSAAIANNGTLMTPYMVQKVTAPDLTPLETAQPTPLSQALSPSEAADMSEMMANVVKQPYGTAHEAAFLPDIAIAAKTGTAQTGVNNTGLDDAVFTCFAPVSNPQIAVGVIVKGGGLGADASAPIAVKIIQAYLASQAK
jgi:peptidoglycan glycosyltransferase